jgi:predicted amidohydrolase
VTEAKALRVGLTQWHATGDVEANLQIALDVIAKAATESADLVVLPENGLMLGSNQQMRAAAFGESAAEVTALREAARAAGVVVVIGGLKNQTPEGVFNSALVIGADGELAGRYDKIHLFDARIDGQSFEASSVEQAGQEPVLIDVGGVPVGLTICYDLRFPELYRRLAAAGAQVLLVPSAFTQKTGDAHWHTLLRARAIENGAFVVAPATIRSAEGGGHDAFETYGHALVVAPWGQVLADLGEAQVAVAVVELDLALVAQARRTLPVLAGTKPDAYAREPRRVTVATRRKWA